MKEQFHYIISISKYKEKWPLYETDEISTYAMYNFSNGKLYKQILRVKNLLIWLKIFTSGK